MSGNCDSLVPLHLGAVLQNILIGYRVARQRLLRPKGEYSVKKRPPRCASWMEVRLFRTKETRYTSDDPRQRQSVLRTEAVNSRHEFCS